MRPQALWALLAAAPACGGATASEAKTPADSPTDFGPLEVGADYATAFTRINRTPFQSPDHGNRWVNTWANDLALPLIFQDHGAFPVGAIVVKESFEDAGGKPSATRGPTFVMEKRAPGYDSEAHDWWWGIHWAEPVGAMAERLGGPIYWRGKAVRGSKVAYCWECHRGYAEHDAVAVGIPEDNQLRPTPSTADDELGADAVEEVQDF